MPIPYTLITEAAPLKKLIASLQDEPVLAIDTEASSFHRYKERICLIQLSTRERTWLIDPVTISDMAPLGAALADKRFEWVIHDADYDLRMLKRMWGFRVARVFDTMVAAELLNEQELGLAANLRKHFDLVLDKKFQKADWSKRPLPEPMLAYAAMDTAYLIRLRDIQARALEERGRSGWAKEEFELLVHIPFEGPEKEEPGFLRIKGAKALKPRQLAVLRELHAWREGVAEKLDRAPFMVLGNDVMIDLAREAPTQVEQLNGRKGIGETTLKRNGAAIISAIARGLALSKEQWPRLERPKRWDRDEDYEDRLKRLKKERDRLAVERDVRQGFVAPNHVLAEVARTMPGDLKALAAVSGMRHWQVKEFGEQLLGSL